MQTSGTYIKVFSLAAAVFTLSACSGTKSTTVTELTQYDKHMSCPELQLEITEASFLRDKAARNRGLSVKNVVMPLSYPATYMNAGSAMEAADNRIEYLSRLTEIKGCNAQQQYASMEAPAGYGQPMPPQAMQQQGMYQQMRYAAPQPMPQQGYAQGGYGGGHYQERPSYGY